MKSLEDVVENIGRLHNIEGDKIFDKIKEIFNDYELLGSTTVMTGFSHIVIGSAMPMEGAIPKDGGKYFATIKDKLGNPPKIYFTLKEISEDHFSVEEVSPDKLSV
ncbi:hypothetical protein ACPWSR_14390 [Alloiococcus sp. CFN-8]|uniref:hypothetical protein n=1 Tax=Alloiococcus sp. CFN-8 TaxID=3416081 RepID=UPI003CF23006